MRNSSVVVLVALLVLLATLATAEGGGQELPLQHLLGTRYSGHWRAVSATTFGVDASTAVICNRLRAADGISASRVAYLCDPSVRLQNVSQEQPSNATAAPTAAASTVAAAAPTAAEDIAKGIDVLHSEGLMPNIEGRFRARFDAAYSSDLTTAAVISPLSTVFGDSVAFRAGSSKMTGLALHYGRLPNSTVADADGALAAGERTFGKRSELFVGTGPLFRALVTVNEARWTPHRNRAWNGSQALGELWANVERAFQPKAVLTRAASTAVHATLQVAGLNKLTSPAEHIRDFTDCEVVAFLEAESPVEGYRTLDAFDDAVDAGRIAQAPRVHLDVVLLCNASNATGLVASLNSQLTAAKLPAVTEKSLTRVASLLSAKDFVKAFNGTLPSADYTKPNWREDAIIASALLEWGRRHALTVVVLRYDSVPDMQASLDAGMYVVAALLLSSVIMALWALIPHALVSRTSTGRMVRFSYAWAIWDGFVFVMSLSVLSGLAGLSGANSRRVFVAAALSQLLVNVVGLKLFLGVRMAHRQLLPDGLASRGFLFHLAVMIAAIIVVTLLGDWVFSPVVMMALNSGLLAQVVHAVRIRDLPAIDGPAAAKLVAARALLLAPILLFPTDYSPFVLPARPFVFVATVAWMSAIAYALHRQAKRGALSILPTAYRPPIHVYGVSHQHVVNALRGASEDAMTCTICRVELYDADDIANSAPAPATNPRRSPDAAAAAAAHVALTIAAPDDAVVWRTPCNHFFHRDCLTRWMDENMVCPLCRTRLPKPLSE